METGLTTPQISKDSTTSISKSKKVSISVSFSRSFPKSKPSALVTSSDASKMNIPSIASTQSSKEHTITLGDYDNIDGASGSGMSTSKQSSKSAPKRQEPISVETSDDEDRSTMSLSPPRFLNIDEEAEQTQKRSGKKSEEDQDLDSSSCSDSSNKTLCTSKQVDEGQEYTDESEHDEEPKLPAKIVARRASTRTASKAALKKISKIMSPKKKGPKNK